MLSKDYVDESEERILNDDYKNWKKSVSFLYNMVMTHALHWPSFTFEWLPSSIRNGTVVKSRILLGSTTDSDKNHVLLADVVFPSEDDLDPDTPFGTFKSGVGRIKLKKRIIHEHAVTKARHMPQRSQIIATTSTHSLNIFDTKNKSYFITEEEIEEFATIPDRFSKPLLQLTGFKHFQGTLSWNLSEAGYILGAGNSKSIGLWDMCSHNSTDDQDVTTIYNGHTGPVTEVAWWPTLPTVFLSSSVDCTIGLWDVRNRCTSRPSHSIHGHKSSVTSVAASPFSQFLFASTSEDSTLALWDVRNLTVKLHSLTNKPNDPMSHVRWSPHASNILASSSASRTISIWDLDALHDADKLQNATPEDPAELMFLHGGHSAAVSDLAWHPDARNIIGSTSNDNIIQIWKPIENLISSSIPQAMQTAVATNQNLTTALESEEIRNE